MNRAERLKEAEGRVKGTERTVKRTEGRKGDLGRPRKGRVNYVLQS